jgi:hypothetical protein
MILFEGRCFMRTIKYRVFDKTFNCYIPTDFIPNPITNIVGDKVYELCLNKVDYKGKEIFEGDIIFAPSGWYGDYRSKPGLYIIEYFDDDSVEIGFNRPMADDINWDDCTVVGNINENPTMIDYEDALEKLNKEFPETKIKDI